jgi:hypothetical protein
MSSEPPFEHPPDHRRYDDPPPPPPRQMPTILTPKFKTGCGVLLGFLLTQCCLCGTIGTVHEEVKKRSDAMDEQLRQINKKLDDMNKKPDDAKKDDANKKDK